MRGRDVRRTALSLVKQHVLQWSRRWYFATHRDCQTWLTDEWLGRTISHHHTCWMCGNPRHYFGQKTIKEQLADCQWQDWCNGERW